MGTVEWFQIHEGLPLPPVVLNMRSGIWWQNLTGVSFGFPGTNWAIAFIWTKQDKHLNVLAATKRCPLVLARRQTYVHYHQFPRNLGLGKGLDHQTQGMGPVICFHINGKLQLPAAATNMKPEEGFTTELQTKLSSVFNVESRDRVKGWVFHSDNCGLKG